MLVAALVVGSLVAGSPALLAQNGGGGGGGRGMRGGVLTPEQNQQMRDAATGSAELTALTAKLSAAQKEAINAALAADATEASVRAKVEAVSAIQTDIAVLRYKVAVNRLLLRSQPIKKLKLTPPRRWLLMASCLAAVLPAAVADVAVVAAAVALAVLLGTINPLLFLSRRDDFESSLFFYFQTVCGT